MKKTTPASASFKLTDKKDIREYVRFLESFGCQRVAPLETLQQRATTLLLLEEDLQKVARLSENFVITSLAKREKEEWDQARSDLENGIILSPHDAELRFQYLDLLQEIHQKFNINRSVTLMLNQAKLLQKESVFSHLSAHQNKKLKEYYQYARTHRKKTPTLRYLWGSLLLLLLFVGVNISLDFYRSYSFKREQERYQKQIEERMRVKEENPVLIKDLPVELTNERWEGAVEFKEDQASFVSHNQTTTYTVKGSLTPKKDVKWGFANIVAMNSKGESVASKRIELAREGKPLPAGVSLPISAKFQSLYAGEPASSLVLVPENLAFAEDGEELSQLFPVVTEEEGPYKEDFTFRLYQKESYQGFDRRYYLYTIIVENNGQEPIREMKYRVSLKNTSSEGISQEAQVVYEEGPVMYPDQRWPSEIRISDTVIDPEFDMISITPTKIVLLNE